MRSDIWPRSNGWAVSRNSDRRAEFPSPKKGKTTNEEVTKKLAILAILAALTNLLPFWQSMIE